MATTNFSFTDESLRNWIKVGNLLVDLCSLELGFKEMERSRRDVWDYSDKTDFEHKKALYILSFLGGVWMVGV